MSEDVLLHFLSNGLINVGGDDTKLEKLRATASDLAGELRTTPAKAASFALVACDPQAPAADPVVKEAVDALSKRWATYMNTFSGTPVAVVRAMLLDALAQGAAADDRIGVALVTSARNALAFMEIGDEKTIWAEVIGRIEANLDARAEREWATPASIVAPPMSLQASATLSAQLEPPKVSRDVLVTKIQAAAGPQPSTGGNQNWPGVNQPWVTEFGKWMAEAVADLVESVVSQTKVSGTGIAEPLQELSKAVSTYVEGTLRAVSSATAGLQRRTNLIWWKQALYSPSARTGYRDLAPEAAAALMALDLHQQVPSFSPASVSAFLHEAVLSLPLVDPERSYPIRDLVVGARQSSEVAPLRSAAAALMPPAQGRGPLLALIAHGLPHSHADAPLSDKKFRDLVGVPANALLALPAWATWLFRELQAARATAKGSETGVSAQKADHK